MRGFDVNPKAREQQRKLQRHLQEGVVPQAESELVRFVVHQTEIVPMHDEVEQPVGNYEARDDRSGKEPAPFWRQHTRERARSQRPDCRAKQAVRIRHVVEIDGHDSRDRGIRSPILSTKVRQRKKADIDKLNGNESRHQAWRSADRLRGKCWTVVTDEQLQPPEKVLRQCTERNWASVERYLVRHPCRDLIGAFRPECDRLAEASERDVGAGFP